MYEAFFGLKERPFVTVPSPHTYFPGAAIEQARQGVMRILQRGAGPSMVIGPVGTGKTLLCRVLARQLRQSFRVALLSSTRVCTRRGFLQAILFELALPYRDLDEGELRLALTGHATSTELCPKGLVLLLDEADRLPRAVLEEIRMLTNVVRDEWPCIQPVLVGSRQLEELVSDPRLESLQQRIAGRFYLEPFSHDEAIAYIQSRLASSGTFSHDLFTPESLTAVYRATHGVPRLINQVCEHAMMLAFVGQVHQIDEDAIQEAWSDLQQLPAVDDSSDDQENVIEFGSLEEEDEDTPTGPPAPDAILSQIEQHLQQLAKDTSPAATNDAEEDAAASARPLPADPPESATAQPTGSADAPQDSGAWTTLPATSPGAVGAENPAPPKAIGPAPPPEPLAEPDPAAGHFARGATPTSPGHEPPIQSSVDQQGTEPAPDKARSEADPLGWDDASPTTEFPPPHWPEGSLPTSPACVAAPETNEEELPDAIPWLDEDPEYTWSAFDPTDAWPVADGFDSPASEDKAGLPEPASSVPGEAPPVGDPNPADPEPSVQNQSAPSGANEAVAEPAWPMAPEWSFLSTAPVGNEPPLPDAEDLSTGDQTGAPEGDGGNEPDTPDVPSLHVTVGDEPDEPLARDPFGEAFEEEEIVLSTSILPTPRTWQTLPTVESPWSRHIAQQLQRLASEMPTSMDRLAAQATVSPDPSPPLEQDHQPGSESGPNAPAERQGWEDDPPIGDIWRDDAAERAAQGAGPWTNGAEPNRAGSDRRDYHRTTDTIPSASARRSDWSSDGDRPDGPLGQRTDARRGLADSAGVESKTGVAVLGVGLPWSDSSLVFSQLVEVSARAEQTDVFTNLVRCAGHRDDLEEFVESVHASASFRDQPLPSLKWLFSQLAAR